MKSLRLIRESFLFSGAAACHAYFHNKVIYFYQFQSDALHRDTLWFWCPFNTWWSIRCWKISSYFYWL